MDHVPMLRMARMAGLVRWRHRAQARAAAMTAPPCRLQIALKPFGKAGVRVGWMLEPSLLEQGCRIFIDALCAGKWTEQSELVHGGASLAIHALLTMLPILPHDLLC